MITFNLLEFYFYCQCNFKYCAQFLKMDKVKEPEGEAVTIAVRQRPLTDEEKENNEEKTGIKHLEDNVNGYTCAVINLITF